MQQPGSQFLHERNPKLHISGDIQNVVGYLRDNGERIPNEPAGMISAYLGFLANSEYVNDGILTGDQSSIDRQIDANVIKAEDVPESYFELQRLIAHEQGHGDVQITPEMRQEAQRIIAEDQRHSLKPWAEYLSGSDSGYPDWFRLYAFESVLKMGKFDKQKEEFQKRSNLTTAPFPELSRGALSQVYSWLKESKVDGEHIGTVFEDEKREALFQKALKSGNFATLYVQAIHKTQEGMITPEQKQELVGSWKTYEQNSDPGQLHGDLQGFGLDWCTATGYETAVTHLADGDFFVYYTRDNEGNNTVPRVAIRMEDGEVAEVRGINEDQELEPEMADITAERLKDLPGGEEYIRKAEDMKRLTAIEKKINANPDSKLTNEELRFLYELDREIKGFGYKKDPRVEEIVSARGNRDVFKFPEIFAELIQIQFDVAATAYQEVSELLGLECVISRDELSDIFTAKQKEWQKQGAFEYIAERYSSQRTKFDLIIVPNLDVSGKQIEELVIEFNRRLGRDSGFVSEVWGYSAEEWSGSTGMAPVRMIIIPQLSEFLPDQEWHVLDEQQANYPELNLYIPSVLDAISYWYRLGADQQRMQSISFRTNPTIIEHFGMRLKQINDKLVVPLTYIGSFPKEGRVGDSEDVYFLDANAKFAIG